MKNPKQVNLVGFCGFARSGKDTAALALVKLGWQRRAFADALKNDMALAIRKALNEVEEFPHWQDMVALFTDPAKKETFRPLLVEYGRAMRNIRPAYWIDRLMVAFATDVADNPDTSVVITDVRYKNEVDAIHDAGGKVIGLRRAGVIAANAEEERSFASVEPDVWLYNDGTIESLHATVLAQVKEWGME